MNIIFPVKRILTRPSTICRCSPAWAHPQGGRKSIRLLLLMHSCRLLETQAFRQEHWITNTSRQNSDTKLTCQGYVPLILLWSSLFFLLHQIDDLTLEVFDSFLLALFNVIPHFLLNLGCFAFEQFHRN